MINNRQAGRRRGRGNNNGGGGGGGPRQGGGGGRSDNGNRIDSRSRGNAAQLLEKYKNLAADSQRQGDRVSTENYLQFADHYFRVLADQQRGRVEDQPQRRQQSEFDGDNDEDYGEEGEPIRGGEQADPRYEQQRSERADRGDQSDQQRGDQSDQQRGERPDRSDRPQRAERAEHPERAERSERPDRYEQQRPDRQQQARRPDGDRPRQWEGDRPERRPDEISGQRRADPPLPGEDLEARAEAVLEADAPLQNDVAPRRRGRPRREAAVDAAVEVSQRPIVDPVDRPDAEAGEAVFNGVEADRLPPSLGSFTGAANDAEGSEAPRPRRRRVRPEASAG